MPTISGAASTLHRHSPFASPLTHTHPCIPFPGPADSPVLAGPSPQSYTTECRVHTGSPLAELSYILSLQTSSCNTPKESPVCKHAPPGAPTHLPTYLPEWPAAAPPGTDQQRPGGVQSPPGSLLPSPALHSERAERVSQRLPATGAPRAGRTRVLSAP